MKILLIRGENLASLAEPFEIVLEHGILASAGLYAITGQTGAGKSTILDAMCLALFNQTPRFSGRGGALIGRADEEEGERLRDTDVRSILRRGAANGYAEVEFSGADGERYRSRWSVRRARNSARGRVQKQEMTLVRVRDGKVLSSNRITETLPQISDALGLQFEQFRRSAMLAQGDFAAFLQADDKARAELLERMTGTEIYREISKACYTQYREVQLELQAAQGQAHAIEILSDEELTKLLEKRTELRQKSVVAAMALEQAQRILRAVEDRTRIEQMLGDAKYTCGQKTQIVAAAQPRRDALSTRRRLAPHWELRRQVQRYQENIVERTDAKNKVDVELSLQHVRKLDCEKRREKLEHQLVDAIRSRKEAQP